MVDGGKFYDHATLMWEMDSIHLTDMIYGLVRAWNLILTNFYRIVVN